MTLLFVSTGRMGKMSQGSSFHQGLYGERIANDRTSLTYHKLRLPLRLIRGSKNDNYRNASIYGTGNGQFCVYGTIVFVGCSCTPLRQLRGNIIDDYRNAAICVTRNGHLCEHVARKQTCSVQMYFDAAVLLSRTEHILLIAMHGLMTYAKIHWNLEWNEKFERAEGPSTCLLLKGRLQSFGSARSAYAPLSSTIWSLIWTWNGTCNIMQCRNHWTTPHIVTYYGQISAEIRASNISYNYFRMKSILFG